MTVWKMRYLFGRGADDITPVGAARFVVPRPLVDGAALAAIRHVERRPLGVGVGVFGAAAVRRPFREETRWSLTAEEGSAPG